MINELKEFFRQTTLVTSLYEIILNETGVARYEDIFATEKANEYRRAIERRQKDIGSVCKAVISLTDTDAFYPAYLRREFIVCSFDAHRKVSFIEPKGPSAIELKDSMEENVGRYFVQLLVNLRAQRAFARDDNNVELIEKIDRWFQSFDNALAVLLGHNDFKLQFDSTNFNFTIQEKNKEPYHFSELSVEVRRRKLSGK